MLVNYNLGWNKRANETSLPLPPLINGEFALKPKSALFSPIIEMEKGVLFFILIVQDCAYCNYGLPIINENSEVNLIRLPSLRPLTFKCDIFFARNIQGLLWHNLQQRASLKT